jgi:hypothetical protein
MPVKPFTTPKLIFGSASESSETKEKYQKSKKNKLALFVDQKT